MATGKIRSSDHASGFSLIELLVVIAVMALLVSTVTLSLAGAGRRAGQLEDIAYALSDLVQIASTQAVVSGEAIGMHWQQPRSASPDGWQLRWSRWREGRWQIDTDPSLQAELPDGVQLDLWVDGHAVELGTDTPVMVLYPTGEASAFELQLAAPDAHTEPVRLGNSASGTVEVFR